MTVHYFHKKPTLCHTIVDKLQLIYYTQDKQNHADVMTLIDSASLDLGKPGYKWWKSKHCTYARHPLPDDQYLWVQAGIAHGKTYAKFGFNPSKLTDDGWGQLHVLLDSTFEHGYATLYESAFLNYVEFATDYGGVSIDDIVVIDPRCRTHNDDHEKQGTFYPGSKKGKNYSSIYDKAKQLKKAKPLCFIDPLTRFERRMRGVKKTLIEIDQLKNPFSRLIIADRKRLLAEKPHDIWTYLGQPIEAGNGIIKCLLALPPPIKKAMIHRLRDYTTYWWQPDFVWEQTVAWSASLHPSKVQQFNYSSPGFCKNLAA